MFLYLKSFWGVFGSVARTVVSLGKCSTWAWEECVPRSCLVTSPVHPAHRHRLSGTDGRRTRPVCLGELRSRYFAPIDWPAFPLETPVRLFAKFSATLWGRTCRGTNGACERQIARLRPACSPAPRPRTTGNTAALPSKLPLFWDDWLIGVSGRKS